MNERGMNWSVLLVLGAGLGLGGGCFRGDDAGAGTSGETATTETGSDEAECGNMIIEDGEECDDGDFNGKVECTVECTISFCGDGLIQANGTELCDDGNDSPNDECVACVPATCGDGQTWEGMEECDDGNADNNDACVDGCLNNVCGDGFKHNGAEECDMGDLEDGDGCSSSCELENCGDGILQESAGEECDDSNNDDYDGCSHECQDEQKRAFVTSMGYAGDLGGHAGADAKCNQRASAASLHGTYKAWISTSDLSAAAHFSDPQVPDRPYVNMLGETLVDDWDELLTGDGLQNPLTYDEYGEEQPGMGFGCSVWTGTEDNGEAVDMTSTCMDWSLPNSQNGGRVGDCFTPSGWTSVGFTEACDLELPIYCFQQ